MSGALAKRPVLLFDAQTTGASPSRGGLLEVAWARFHGFEPDAPTIHGTLVAQPTGTRIPRRIRELTGIKNADLHGAPSPEAVWRSFRDALDGLSSESEGTPWVVVHYARFEKAFLTDLHDRFGTDPWPMQLVCTHEIARRLFPDLPRRGIRALAGYLGHRISDLKRAGDNTAATAIIWRELTTILDEEEGVDTPEGLLDWLATVKPAKRGKYQFAVSRDARLALPKGPGVYRMVGRQGQVLYVGKAASLKRRVNSYFQKRRGHSERIMELITSAHDVDITETGSALEAALLESDEIKRLEPPFNIALKRGDRAIGFSTMALEALDAPTASCLGPLPSPEAMEPLRVLREVLSEGRPIDGETMAWILQLPARHTPDEATFKAGLARFVRAQSLEAPEGRWEEAFWRVGARLWWDWRQARAEDDGESDAVELDTETRSDWSWTAEGVETSLAGTVMGRARLVRRAAWMRRLMASSVVWTPRHTPEIRRALVVSGGHIVQSGVLEADAPPLAPGVERGLAGFDPVMYDRLRVLTTELRRVVGEGREVVFRSGPRGVLDGAALGRVLWWV